ncbi:carotenoid oxygenase [Phycomyces nitens]|nr:carotenoid oxygenase [Phycomyces nitens]
MSLAILVFVILAAILWLNPLRILQRLNTFLILPELIASFQVSTFRNAPEIREPKSLAVKGNIPEWFNGIMYRVGPGKYNLEKEDGSILAIKHAFDGMPYLHRFEISSTSQTVNYNSRNLAESYEASVVRDKGMGKIFYGHVPVMNSIWQRIYNITLRITTALYNSLFIDSLPASGQAIGVTVSPNFPIPPACAKADRDKGRDGRVLVTKTDANMLQQVHPDTLEPERLFNYTSIDSRIKGDASAAHHQYDPVTKETINFVMNIFPAQFQVFSSTPEGKITILATITHRMDGTGQHIRPSYIHSFGMTKDYIILPEQPLAYSNIGLDLMKSGTVITGMKWDDTIDTYIHIISRHGKGHIATISVDPFLCFHFGNCWQSVDKDGLVVLNADMCTYLDADIMFQVNTLGDPVRQSNYMEHLKEQARRKSQATKINGISVPPLKLESLCDLRRYTITLGTSKISAEYRRITNNFDFPRFSQDFMMRESKYLYGCRFHPPTQTDGEHTRLIKVDTETGKTIQYGGPGYCCSEPIFAPRPGSTEEDEGVLMSLVNRFDNEDPDMDSCSWVLLDAKTMEEVASCEIGQFAITTFHGSFVDDYFESVSVN